MTDTSEAEIDRFRRGGIEVLPDGSCDSENAGKVLGRATKTLAQWRMYGKGPRYQRDAAGKPWYQLDELVRFKSGGDETHQTAALKP